MPDHRHPPTSLEIIERRFIELTAPPAALSLDGASIGFGLPDRAIPLDEGRILLLKRQTGNHVKNAIWREIVQRAQTTVNRGSPARSG
jgi:hypothetical protein